jgi:hypothetical protein
MQFGPSHLKDLETAVISDAWLEVTGDRIPVCFYSSRGDLGRKSRYLVWVSLMTAAVEKYQQYPSEREAAAIEMLDRHIDIVAAAYRTTRGNAILIDLIYTGNVGKMADYCAIRGITHPGAKAALWREICAELYGDLVKAQ